MILCCGEALIDMLPRDTADGEPAFLPRPGGAVFNTAIALGRLGQRTDLFTGLSHDLFGEMLATALAEAGVSYGLARRSARPTTLAFVTLSGGQAAYAFYDENTAGRMLDIGDLPEPGADVRACFFGGISLAAEPCGSAYEALALRVAKSRALMLDPNIRPGFIADAPAYRDRLDRMIAASDLLKVSDEDLRWLAGPGETAELAAAMLKRGPAAVVVTEGARGAGVYSASGALWEPAVPARVVDTVGAGDTFNAGFLAGLADMGALDKLAVRALPDEALRAALRLGARAAAVTVSRAGANPPTRAELS